MANKRIRDLTTTNTFPEGALVPLDAAGLSEAQAIGSSKLVDAVSLVIAPPLVVNKKSASEGNSDALDAALAQYAASGNKKTILRLPRGIVHLKRVFPITWEHSGITIDGDGCIIVQPAPNPNGAPAEFILAIGLTGEAPAGFEDVFTYTPGLKVLTFSSPAVLVNYKEGDALLLFPFNPSAEDRVSPQQTVTIVSVNPPTVTVAEPLIAGLTRAKWLRKGRRVKDAVPAGTTTIVLQGTVHKMKWKHSWIYITDGVGVIELYGEYVRVLDASVAGAETTLTLETGVRQSYIAGRAAVIPSGRWVQDVTIRNLTLGGKYDYDHATANLVAKFCLGLRLEGVKSTVVQKKLADAGALISTSQRVVISDGQFTERNGLWLGATRDVVVERTRALVRNEEFCSNILYRDCDINEAYKHIIGCSDTHAERCRFLNVEHFGIGDDCSLENCEVYGPSGDFYVTANRNRFSNVRCMTGTLRLDIQNGCDHYLEDIRANVRLHSSSTGEIVGRIIGELTGYHESMPGPLPASWVRLTRVAVKKQLPTTVGHVIVLGKLGDSRGAVWARVSLVVRASGVSMARQYFICRGWDNPSNWYICLPNNEGKHIYNAADFTLELREDESWCWLRVRRTVGTDPAELAGYIESNALFEPGGSPPSGSIADGYHESTSAVQRDGLLYLTSVVLMQTEAPDSAKLADGQCSLWFDKNGSPPAFKIKAKIGSTIYTGTVNLST